MTAPFRKCLQVVLVILSLSGNAHATFHLWRINQLYSNADGSVQFVVLEAMASNQQFLTGHTITSGQGSNTNTYTFTQPLPGDTAETTGGGGYGGYGGMVTTYKMMLIGTQGFAALNVVQPDYVVPNGFLFTTNGTVNWGGGSDVFSYAALPTDGRLALNRNGTTSTNAPINFDGQMGTVVGTPAGGGSTAKTLGSRATASPSATLFGGFELATASSVYILVRGNSLGTLGVTQNFLDAPRLRLFNSQGQDLLMDAGAAGFTGCGNANAGGPVVTYYTGTRGQPPNARDACTAQVLAAGVYTFTVTPSTMGMMSSPASGETLFEVTLGTGGSMTKSLGSRATASPTATLFGGFEVASASTVHILVRGNSLGTLGVTQNFLDAPRVRLFNSQGQDLITEGGVAGFTGCSAANSGASVVSYYTNVRGQPPHARDGCTSQSLAAGVYTFSVSPSTSGMISAPASGEILFEVTLNP